MTNRESRLESVRYLPGQGILPGTPDPAEAGTPARRYPDETFNVHQAARQFRLAI